MLYFYPKDDTSGCTAEAQGFTAAAADFAADGTVVVGVSKDSVASHQKFKAKYGLEPLLGSAKDDDMVERYGAWIEKSMYGRKYMGIDRSTYLDRRGWSYPPRLAKGPSAGPRRRSARGRPRHCRLIRIGGHWRQGLDGVKGWVAARSRHWSRRPSVQPRPSHVQ